PATRPPAGGSALPAADRTQPRIRLISGWRQSIRRLRTAGLVFRLSVDEPATLHVTVRGRFSRRAKHGAPAGRGPRRTLAVATARTTRAGQVVTVRLKVSGTLRARLRRERRLPGLLSVIATDAAGNSS